MRRYFKMDIISITTDKKRLIVRNSRTLYKLQLYAHETKIQSIFERGEENDMKREKNNRGVWLSLFPLFYFLIPEAADGRGSTQLVFH